MKKLLLAALVGSGFLSCNALAHGEPKARHGGVVQTVDDLSFELVPRDAGAVLHLTDHDKPVDAGKLSGRLTVLNGSRKSEADLRPSATSAGTLEAAGVQVAPGSKVVAAIDGLARRTLTVRFSVK